MQNMDSKEKQELAVFREFAEVCPMTIVANAAENRKPPEPDILCEVKDGPNVAFELVRAEDVTTYTDAKGEVYVQSIQYKESQPGVHFSTVGTSIVDKVEEKLKKARAGKYLTDHPLHLLVWSDTASSREWFAWRDDLERLLANGTGQFERIWVYGRSKREIAFDSKEAAT
jgi:hypothetical protein